MSARRCSWGALGGMLGSRVGNGSAAGTIIGAVAETLLGVVLGDQISRGMNPYDRFCTGRALDFADDQHLVNWINPQSQIDYAITPLRSFQNYGTLCREFTTQLTHQDRSESDQQTACKMPDGNWEIRTWERSLSDATRWFG